MSPERQVAAFIEATTPILGDLVISAIHSMAYQDCDLAAGDTYKDADYREHATAAVGAVLQHLAWSDALTAFIDSLTERADLPKATTPVDDPRASGGHLVPRPKSRWEYPGAAPSERPDGES